MSSLAYTFTIGPGDLSKQGLYLLRSIRENTKASKDEVFVFIVKEEKSEIDQEVLDEVQKKATLLEGEMPNPNYPLSAAHGALKNASEETEKEYLLLFDTDTAVLDDITVHEEKDADLFLTPVPTSYKYWNSSEKSNEEFRKLFDEYGFEYPEDIDLKSNYDRGKVNPYYNGGFILTKTNDFPKRWLELSEEVFGNLPRKNYFSEMIALALLASDYKVEPLGPEYNFFLPFRPYPQEGTKMVHYLELETLYRSVYLSKKIGSGWFVSQLENTGILEDYKSMNKIKRSLMILNESYKSYTTEVKNRELLNYKIRMKIIRLLELTGTKQLARDIANWILGKEKFKEENY